MSPLGRQGKTSRRPAQGVAVKNRPERIAAFEKRMKALELRKAGLTFGRIAIELGYHDASHASRAVEQALVETAPLAVADEVRALELARLDELWQPMYVRALQGDRLAVDRCLSIMERRAAYLGLDAPVRFQAEVITAQQLQGVIDQMDRDAAALEQALEGRDLDEAILDAEVVE